MSSINLTFNVAMVTKQAQNWKVAILEHRHMKEKST